MGQRDHQTIVITGASGNVGAAITARLRGSAPLALLERSRVSSAPSATNVQTFGGVDLADDVTLAAHVARVRDALGPVRALVHTVGGYADGHGVASQPAELVRRMLELNYVTAVNAVRCVLPHITQSQHGRIILFGSADALKGRGGASAYAASKAALLRFAEALADEVNADGVGVHVIVPTTIDTPQNRAAMPDADVSRWVSPAEIAEIVAFLLAPESAGLRFTVVPVGH